VVAVRLEEESEIDDLLREAVDPFKDFEFSDANLA
jgi:hypothetical protein